jgi:aspartate aminotransferase
MVLLADAKPVIIETTFEQHFKITDEQLKNAITPKTRLIIINSPSNPSGLVYSRAELIQLANVLLEYPQIIIASDDIYESILWTAEPFHNILMVCPELYDRTIIHNGVSKTYAMTGWRIGYSAGNAQLITAMTNIQSQSTSNPNSIAQAAAQAAINGDQHCVREMVNAFHQRHELIMNELQQVSDIRYHPSDGTFYSFIDVQKIIENKHMQNDIEFSEYLLNQTGIALVPGSAFGTPGCIRLSFAISNDLLLEALKRLKNIF